MDSRAETLKHSQRVGELMGEVIIELVKRSQKHDRSKTESPEVEIFDEYTEKLKDLTYGSPEYTASLEAMGDAITHHYEHNRHHPEHYIEGIDGMTLVDLIEMLADWKAATERVKDGSLSESLKIQKARFGMTDQLYNILENTAEDKVWI